MAYAFNDDKSKNDLSDVVRDSDITDVVRVNDIKVDKIVLHGYNDPEGQTYHTISANSAKTFYGSTDKKVIGIKGVRLWDDNDYSGDVVLCDIRPDWDYPDISHTNTFAVTVRNVTSASKYVVEPTLYYTYLDK